MSFLYPSFLFALAAIGIPIIIHLFNFRRYKTVYFTNVRFLREVKEQTDSRSRLKHLLILGCRILSIIFLVLAFAQPFIRNKSTVVNTGKKAVSVFIDNSFSMGQLVADVPLIEQAKLKAREIVDAYAADDEFQLLTGDFEGSRQRLVDKEEMLNLIKEVKPSTKSQNFSDIISRQMQALNKSNASQKVIFMLSDFQKNFSDFNLLKTDSNFQINIVPLTPKITANLYIDTCWMESPVQIRGQINTLLVRIRNEGDLPVENGRLTLQVNNQTKAISNFSVASSSFVIDSISYTITEAGWSRAELSVIDHPITFDDTYFLSYEVSEHVNVMEINESQLSPYLNALFGKNEFFVFRQVPYNQLNYAELFRHDFVILNGLRQLSTGLAAELKKFVEQGGNLLVFPDANADISSYNALLQLLGSDIISTFTMQKKTVSKVNNLDPLFADVFQQVPQNLSLPQASGSLSLIKRTTTTSLPLLTFSDGSSFMNKYVVGGGLFFLSAVPLDKSYTDFPVNPLFAPLIYRMAIFRESSPANALVIGHDNLIGIPADLSHSDQVLRLTGLSDEFIPPQRLIGNQVIVNISNEISQAGMYSLKDPNGTEQAVVAMNYDRLESDLRFMSMEELLTAGKQLNIRVIQNYKRDLSNVIAGQGLGLPLWKVSVIFVLLFIALEIVLLKFWK